MTDFLETEAGQCAVIAKQFLEAAEVVTAAQIERGRILHRPALFLAGQGLEQLVKACIWINGSQPPTKGREGHDILSLWPRHECSILRLMIFQNAEVAAEEARASHRFRDVPSHADVREMMEDHVASLANLHGRKDYPLRYQGIPSDRGPQPFLLTRALWLTADDLVKRPETFRNR
jgi:hypothetical protein